MANLNGKAWEGVSVLGPFGDLGGVCNFMYQVAGVHCRSSCGPARIASVEAICNLCSETSALVFMEIHPENLFTTVFVRHIYLEDAKS